MNRFLPRRLTPCLLVVLGLVLACGGSTGGGGTGGGDAGSCTTDTDNDGLSDCDEALYGTNPNLADTDGDGYSDGVEVHQYLFNAQNNNFRFNPLIADLPRLGLRFTSSPAVTLNCSDTTGTSRSVQVTNGTQVDSTQTHSNSTANGTAYEVADTVGVSATVGGEVGTDGIKATASATASYSNTTTSTTESTVTYTSEQSTTQSNSYQMALSNEQSQSHTCNDGTISLTVKLSNDGALTFQPSAVSLSALVVAPRGARILRGVGTLSYPANGGAIGTLGPNNTTGDLVFTATGVSLDTIRALLVDSSGLQVAVATYDVLGTGGSSLNSVLTEVNARDATVIIDYGGKLGMGVERFAVSVVASSAAPRLSAQDVLRRILKRDFVQGVPALDGGVAAPAALAGVVAPVDGGTVIGTDLGNRQFWEVAHVTVDSSNQRQVAIYKPSAAYDFGNLVLKPGDVLQLTYMEDLDGDGLGIRQEAAFATSDTNPDTDGDSLTDYQEAYLYSTDPIRADPDGDGLDDSLEVHLQLDPYSAHTTPGMIDAQTRFVSLALTEHYGLGIAYDGSLWAWGDPLNLPVVTGCTGTCWQRPVQLGTLAPHAGHRWYGIWPAGYYSGFHGYALRDDQTLWAFGDNEYGYLGQGTVAASTTLVQIPTPAGATGWSQVAAGTEHTAALDDQGHLWVWGLDLSARLGVTTTTTCQSHAGGGSLYDCVKAPAALDPTHIYTQVAAGNGYSLAVRDDSTLWAWGANPFGALGIGGTTPSYTLQRVGTDADWNQVFGSNFIQNASTFATKIDGSLWAWGQNGTGTLGLGDTATHEVPTRVGTGTDWHQAAPGLSSSIFATYGGAAYLSDSTGALVLAPAPLDSQVAFVTAGSNAFGAVDWHLVAWVWGNNSFGRLGVGDTTARTAPVPLGNYVIHPF